MRKRPFALAAGDDVRHRHTKRLHKAQRLLPIESVVSRLPPSLKLSYETDVHKKVVVPAPGLWMAVPKGPKAFAWFTYDGQTDDPVCYMIQMKRGATVEWVAVVNACFDAGLSSGHGTLLFGTLLPCTGAFHVEDILEHRGQLVGQRRWPEKVTLLTSLFQNELRNLADLDILQSFCCATLTADPLTMMQRLHEVHPSVPIYAVQYLTAHGPHKQQQLLDDFWLQQEEGQRALRWVPGPSSKEQQQEDAEKPQEQLPHLHPPVKKDKQPYVAHGKERLWRVKADAQNDIYHLSDPETGDYGGVALVPDYVTSVQLNALFRVIKENQRLDALEESDDEEEFEDVREDKFVLPAVEHVLRCTYHGRFKKWVPLVGDHHQPKKDNRKEKEKFNHRQR